jgi:hypothetical protein
MRLHELVKVPTVGDVLPNGATVLDSVINRIEQFDDEGTYRYGYVLALYGNEFVTWVLGVRPSGEWVTMWGHYYSSISRAVEGYSKRVGVTA